MTTINTTATADEHMNADQTSIDLTPRQQELLLKGLAFVRSNVALEMQIPSDEVDEKRAQQYAELDDLESKLAEPRTPRRPR